MTDCKHKWWALNRIVEGAHPVVTKDSTSIEVETYGKQCSKCKKIDIFDKPRPVDEIPTHLKVLMNLIKGIRKEL